MKIVPKNNERKRIEKKKKKSHSHACVEISEGKEQKIKNVIIGCE